MPWSHTLNHGDTRGLSGNPPISLDRGVRLLLYLYPGEIGAVLNGGAWASILTLTSPGQVARLSGHVQMYYRINEI